jgi:DNA-binding GntR family transcriptional regulator
LSRKIINLCSITVAEATPQPVSGAALEGLLARPAISRDAEAPFHAQVRNHLIELIESGALTTGIRLPPERELARAWGVSLAPVRQAILDLASAGYLYRLRGSGTYVREAKVEEKLSILSSFTETLKSTGREAEVRVLSQQRTPAPPGIARALGTRARTLLLIERLGLLAGEPVAHLAAYLSPSAFPGLTAGRFAHGSLYETLAERYGVRPSRATSLIEVIRTSAVQAALLGIERGAPALQVEGTTFDQNDHPFEFTRVVYRADRFRFSLESHRESDRVIHVVASGDGDHEEQP